MDEGCSAVQTFRLIIVEYHVVSEKLSCVFTVFVSANASFSSGIFVRSAAHCSSFELTGYPYID